MADKIDKVVVKAGRLIRVLNRFKKNAAKKWYYSVWVEDAWGRQRALSAVHRERDPESRRKGEEEPRRPPREKFALESYRLANIS
jgi:hypothetical protein